MFKTILALALISSAPAFACDVMSAQFTGTVKNSTSIPTGEAAYRCTYQVEFARFATNAECPLAQSDAAKAEFEDYSCSIHDGQAVSGTVSRQGDFYFISLN